jgi:lysophospholipase L1-like esterase
MKFVKILSLVILTMSLLIASPAAAEVNIPGVQVSIELNGVEVLSPFNHLANSTTYVDAEVYAKLVNAKYSYDIKSKKVIVNGKTMDARLVEDIPTVAIRPLVDATAGHYTIEWEGKTRTVHILDLPAGVERLNPNADGMVELWAKSGDLPLGPIFGVEHGKLVFLEYRVGQDFFINGNSLDDLDAFRGIPSPAVDHIRFNFLEEGQPGLESPHYDIHIFFIPSAERDQLKMFDVNAEKMSLVALGDSIPFGYGLEASNLLPSKKAYPHLIGGGFVYTANSELTVSGMKSAELLIALQTAEYQAALKQADVVTLTIGSNDVFGIYGPAQDIIAKVLEDAAYIPTAAEQEFLSKGADDFELNFPKIVTEIRKHTNATLVVYNIYNPFPTDFAPALTNLNGLGESLIPQMNEKIKQTVDTNGPNVMLADAYTAFNGKQLTYVGLLQMDVHPTISGQETLARLAEEALKH